MNCIRKPLAWRMDGDCIRCTSHGVNGNRYVQIWRNGKSFLLHRVITERRNRTTLSAGCVARHACDNSWCIRPDHLSIGTPQDNTNDMINRGRAKPAQGERVSSSKLSTTQVLAIHADTRIHREIAESYGVQRVCILKIKTGKTWKHIAKLLNVTQ